MREREKSEMKGGKFVGLDETALLCSTSHIRTHTLGFT